MPAEVAPDPLAPPTERLSGPPVLYSRSHLDDFAASAAGGPLTPDAWARALAAPPADLLLAQRQHGPHANAESADPSRLPAAGEEFAGFRLIRELGRGAFARVFLAEQLDLSDRQMVLKVAVDARTEVKLLARLLHTNIVPVYSVHRSGLYQAVCMPYCGSMTLAEAIRRFRGETLPESGKGLVTLITSSAPSSTPAAAAPPAPSRRPTARPPIRPARLPCWTCSADCHMSTRCCGSGPGWPTGWPTPTTTASSTGT